MLLAELKAIFAEGFSYQAIIDALTLIIGKILGFVAEEEGYVEEETTVA